MKKKVWNENMVFSPYIRVAYEQNKIINKNAKLDFFDNFNQKIIENQTIKKIINYENFTWSED